MKRIYGEDVKRIQMEILDVVAAFCEANNISYWIDSGTLLGAIRHKGYIPWDDDIDVGMLRPDFERFMELFNKENKKYKFHCIENNPNFYYAHGKVLDTDTVLYEPDINGYKLSINIDIFVYDNVPDDATATKMYNKRDLFHKLHDGRVSLNVPQGKGIKPLLVRLLFRAIRIFPKNFFVKKMAQNARKYAKKETEFVGNFTSYTRMICAKSVFDDFIMAEFEGKKYKIPVGYDAWLRAFYGEYMRLPPEEKRVSHHRYEAYVHE